MSSPAGEIPEADAILLSAYVDGELSEAERVELEKRLSQEPNLQAELQSMREQGGVLKALDDPERPTDSQATAGFKAFRNTLANAAPDEIPTVPALSPPRFRRFAFTIACLIAVLVVPGILRQIAARKKATEFSAWRLETLNGRGHVERNGRLYEVFAGEVLQYSDALLLEPNGREEGHALLKGPNETELSTGIDAKSSPSLVIGADNGIKLEEGRFTVKLPSEEAANAVKLTTPDGAVTTQGKAPWMFEVFVRAKK